MLLLRVIGVGKIKEPFLRDGIAEYTKRLSKYIRLEFDEVADDPLPSTLSEMEEKKILIREGGRVLRLIPDRERVILLDCAGRQLTSEEIASYLRELSLSGSPRATFVIGGSLGVSEALISRADERWSLSPLTFTHQFVRLILLEQLYRACRINANERYHH